MSKEAYYFSHDSNARNDPKILSMRSVYGSEGYGWYWIIIEMLRDQDDFKIEITKYVWNALAMQTQCNADAMRKFVDDCINEFKLFVSDGEFFWSESLIRRMEIRNVKSEKARKAAAARWGNSSNDNDSTESECERNADAMQTHSERNAIKGKERKGNKNKEKDKNNIPLEIENFRQRYSEHQLKIIDNYLEMIRHTRTSGKISDSVILGMYQDWDKHPQICVEYGLKTHAENPAYHSRKENYTMGIIRNTPADEAASKLKGMTQKPKNEIDWEEL